MSDFVPAPQEGVEAMWLMVNAAYPLRGNTRPRTPLGQFIEKTVTRTLNRLDAINALPDEQQAEWRMLVEEKRVAKAKVEAEAKLSERPLRRIVQEPQTGVERALSREWHEADERLFQWEKAALTRFAIEHGYLVPDVDLPESMMQPMLLESQEERLAK